MEYSGKELDHVYTALDQKVKSLPLLRSTFHSQDYYMSHKNTCSDTFDPSVRHHVVAMHFLTVETAVHVQGQSAIDEWDSEGLTL